MNDHKKKEKDSSLNVDDPEISVEKEKKCQNELADLEHKYKRALADYQNLEKRVREDRSDLIRMANRELLTRILPVLDTLFLAQKHSDDQSFKVSAQQFLDALKDEGVTLIDTSDQEFDPEKMEAVSTEDGEEGKVLSEVRAGFLLNGQLLRAAQVIVGKSK